MPFFSWTEVLFNHAVKLHDYWFVQVSKNEPMGQQRSCTNLWRRYPLNSRRNGRGIWLYKRSFRHRILRFFLLQRRRLRLNWSRSLLAVDMPHTPHCRTGRGEGRVPPMPDRPPKGLSWETSWHPVLFRVQRELCLLLQGPYKWPCNCLLW